MDSYGEYEPEGLVESSFTIACSALPVARKEREEPLADAFPILAKYEQNAGPSDLRKQGYLKARSEARRAFENTLSSIFEPTLTAVDAFCLKEKADPIHYIPGSFGNDSAKRLRTAALVGPQLSHSLQDRIRDLFQGGEDRHWATLHPREYTSLAAAIRLVVARLSRTLSSDCDPSRLSSLSALPSSSTAIIYLPSISLHKSRVLNDLIKALHSISQHSSQPRLVLLLGLEGGVSSLDDKLEPDCLQLLEIKRFPICTPQRAFDVMMQKVFLDPGVQLDVWLGPSALEMLRYQYFERGFDLEKACWTVELAYHHHFTTRPLSAAAAIPTDPDCNDWEQVFFDRLRLAIVDSDIDGKITVPKPIDGQPFETKQSYLQRLLMDNSALLASMADFSTAVRSHRSSLRRSIHLLHALRARFLNQASEEHDDEAPLGPRKTSLGGLALYVLSEKGVRGFVQGALTALKRAPVRDIVAALLDMKESEWTQDEMFQLQLVSHLSKARAEVDKEGEEGPEEEAKLSGSERVEMVRRRLVREEESEAVKKSVAEWLSAVIQAPTTTRLVLTDVYVYDFSTYLTMLLDPSPRGSILASLNDPVALFNIDEGAMPDVCRLYQMYLSAGKMINLADWFQAFNQSVQASAKRPRSSDTRKVDDRMVRKDMIQVRFALAVNELGRMGFLKKTRRKADHVLKVVHDLPATE